MTSELRGYFAIGAEGINKSRNVGALMRTAHAFGASFVFTVDETYSVKEGNRSDTSKTSNSLPLYNFPDIKSMNLPEKCSIIGIELTDDAINLPSFKHPLQAAYILGPEQGSLSPEMVELCDHIIKIPTKFCINVSVAGALVMYDRVTSLGKYPSRPIMPGGGVTEVDNHHFAIAKCKRK